MADTLRTQRLVLRTPEEADLDSLAAILAEPEVAAFWPGFTRERVHAELVVPDPELTVWAIVAEGRCIGAIQCGEELDPGYFHASIDLFLGRASWGRGYGQEAIRAVVLFLFEARGHHRLTIDPSASNARAIRTYERVGFRRVGVLRDYERGGDGTWHDGLLMELLRRDFEPK